MREIFKKLIVDFQERKEFNVIKRDYNIPLDTKKIVSLIGVRRCGKTYLMYQLINELKRDISIENIVYINFEDDRLYPLSVQDLDDLIEGYYELYPHKRDEKVYLFLDEVQNVDGWERFVRRIYDTLNVAIYVTGSSSKLLSKEIATSLRGRTITFEIFPFSFKEYLRYKNIEINLYSSKSLSFIKNSFNDYLINGGFAETFDESKEIKRYILKDYLDLIIYKDVIERYKIKNQALIKHLIKYFFLNMASSVSFSKLYNEYKSLGYKISKDTIYEYTNYLQDAYTFFTIPIFKNSVKAENRHPKKIFAIDNGFRELFDASISKDYSKLYENLSFLHLRRQSDEIYYYKGKQEVDFYANIKGVKTIVNVSYSIDSEQTLKREINSLLEGMDYFNVKESFLITSTKENTVEIEGKIVKIVPLWKWLLG